MAYSGRIPIICFALLLSAGVRAEGVGPNWASLASRIDSEHIFGFAEGTDIGAQGDIEIESITIASFGATAGFYADANNETSFRYNLTDELRLSIGALTDYFAIRDVPGLDGRAAAEYSGVIAEARWHILDWRTSPFGMSVSINPIWRRADPTSGKRSGNFAVPVTLLLDTELIPAKAFGVLNLIYEPSFLCPGFIPEHDDSFAVVAGASYAILPDILIGAEIRHETLAQNGNVNAHALFVGPQLFLRFSENFAAKIAWAAQIPGVGSHSLDLANYPRDQVEVLFALGF